MLRHFVNILLWFLPPSRMFGFRRACLRLARVRVGNDTAVCGRGWIYGRGRLQIGDGTWISPGIVVHTNPAVDIVIGRNCDVGPSVELITGSHMVGPADRRAGTGRADPIQIGDGCWIGAGVRILGGCTIGTGSVVAAGAVVIHDVPDHVLVAGVPATVKKRLA